MSSSLYSSLKKLIRSSMLKQWWWGCEGPCSAGTFFVQKVTGPQWASCRDRFSWSSINSVCREAALTQGKIHCASIKNSVTFLTINGFPMHSRTCFHMLKTSKRIWEFTISFSKNSTWFWWWFFCLVCSKSFGKCSMPSCMSSLNTSSSLWKAHTADMRQLTVLFLPWSLTLRSLGWDLKSVRNATASIFSSFCRKSTNSVAFAFSAQTEWLEALCERPKNAPVPLLGHLTSSKVALTSVRNVHRMSCSADDAFK